MKCFWQVVKTERNDWIVIEWKGDKRSSWRSGNFSCKELAETRMRKRKALIENLKLGESARTLTRKEISAILSQNTFKKSKRATAKKVKK